MPLAGRDYPNRPPERKHLSMIRTLLTAVACLTAAGSLLSQNPGQHDGSERFVERPGALEFSGRMIVRPWQMVDLLQQGHSQSSAHLIRESAAARLDGWRIRYYEDVDEHIVSVPAGLDENSFAALLDSTGEYQYVHPDWICYPLQAPNDPNYGSQWHHQTMSSEMGWDIHVGTTATTAAWVDTGVDTNHPDLQANLVSGYNSVDKIPQSSGGNVEDINGHGTHVAGCIGAIGNNGTGVAGVAWDMSLMPIKTSNFSSGGAYLSDILDGARWATSNGAKTASASYTGVENPSVGTTGTEVKNNGGLFFYAADNYNQNHSSFDYPDTIVVGGTDQNDNKASFSSYGVAIDVTGPAVDVWSTRLGGTYGGSSGTSFSTPLANGVTAMIWSANPYLTPDEAQQVLYGSVDDIGAPGEDDTFGHGRLNLHQALLDATQGSMDLSLGNLTAGTSATLTVTGSAGGTVWFVYSLDGLAAYPVASLSTSLGVANPVLLGSSNSGSFVGNVPMGTTGVDVWLQAIESGNTSDVEFRTIM
ncbi:MAG: hypothetical protein DWQ01_13180 [Planctomycetota bacterium]|nr:MAG: hypothetical protein DWQ01_13180 [Planctomycetota bacterium]